MDHATAGCFTNGGNGCAIEVKSTNGSQLGVIDD